MQDARMIIIARMIRWFVPAGLGLMLFGCSPGRLTGKDLVSEIGPVTPLEVSRGIELPEIPTASDSEERLVRETVYHRAMYARLLRVLATFYQEHGLDEKGRWAARELSELEMVTPYSYAWDAGVAVAADPKTGKRQAPLTSLDSPAGIDLPDIVVADRTEVDLVEAMILHRTMYGRFLRALATYYVEMGISPKADWALGEIMDARHVKPYRYIRDAIAPVSTLRPTDSIAEADALFQEGRRLMKKAGHGTPVFYAQDIMKLALAKFKQMINTYPTSDKIDDAAFYIGEIHKEYFEELDNGIALIWYTRAIDWNPRVPLPARFQMAVVYDYRLHEREEALHWYQEVVDHEADVDASNLRFASRRVAQLTSAHTRRMETVTPEPKPVVPQPSPAPGPGATAPPAREGTNAPKPDADSSREALPEPEPNRPRVLVP